MLESELNAIEINQTWYTIDLPYDKKEIDVKQIYKLKLNLDGPIVQCKARLVERNSCKDKE